MNITDVTWGNYRQGNGYKYYLPIPINHPWKWEHASLNTLLEEASIKLGELNSFARLVPNIDLFIQLHVTMEAVISSRIEGTQTNLDEALLPEEDIKPERRDDWKEVQSYTSAMNYAIGALSEVPISSRLICNTHEILLSGVRGEHKLPGEYRKSQNWIGGATLKDAKFIPPDHPHIPDLMSDLEKFIHNEDLEVPDLIRAGMMHYQFETIHPFLDGNGRIGRLLISLYLIYKGIMNKPLLYLSKFFEQHKSTYYDNLTMVREKNDMTQWLEFFLIGIRNTSNEAATTLSSILSLKSQLETKIRTDWGKRAHNGLVLLEYLFSQPLVEIKDVSHKCNLSAKAAGELVRKFEDTGILEEITQQSRNRVYVFRAYLDKFRA